VIIFGRKPGKRFGLLSYCGAVPATPAKINRKPTARDGLDVPSTLAAISLKGSRWFFAEPNEPFTVSQALAG
jgi:hypothetical protein